MTEKNDKQDKAAIEQEISQWAQGIRHSFTSREAYNEAVCDRLAAAGIPPLTAFVLRVGRWGATSSVGDDVQAWYSRIGQRLQSLESQIPLAARQQANGLIEQVWRLARMEADQSRVQPLVMELDGLKIDLQRSQTALDDLIDERAALKTSLADAQAFGVASSQAARNAEARLETERRETQQAIEARESEIRRLTVELNAAMAARIQDAANLAEVRETAAMRESELHRRHQTALSDSQREMRSTHAQEKADLIRVADQERARIMLQLDAERATLDSERKQRDKITNAYIELQATSGRQANEIASLKEAQRLAHEAAQAAAQAQQQAADHKADQDARTIREMPGHVADSIRGAIGEGRMSLPGAQELADWIDAQWPR